jgi:hypothetical protein
MSIERGSLLLQTGRHEAAEQEFRAALVEEPSSALAHAMMAYCLVNQKKYAEATDEAQQAIALRPDWNLGYSALATVFLERERPKEAAAAIDKAIALPIVIAYCVFAYMTWLAAPLFNLMLRIDRFGRYALSRDQRISSNWVAGCLLIGLVLAVVWLVRHDSLCGLAALIVAVFSIPSVAVFSCKPGWPRWSMVGYASVLGLIGATVIGLMFYAYSRSDVRLFNNAMGLSRIYLYGLIASQFVANGLSMASVKR